MSSPPVTDREYAYFTAQGYFDPEEMTRIIGREPSESWNVGDSFTMRGRTRQRRGSFWKLDSGCDETVPLENHIDALLGILGSYRSGLLEASTFAELRIQCVSYRYQGFHWDLNTRQMQAAVALNIGFCFYTQSLIDHHEELIALREQLGMRQEIDDDQS